MQKNLNIFEILRASRPISWLNTFVPFVIGYYLGGGAWDLPAYLAAFYFLIPYNLLVYGINDVFDYESDINNPRKGGVEGGLLTPAKNKQLLHVVLFVSVVSSGLLLLLGPLLAQVWLVFLVFMAAAYSVPKLRFKERAFIDSITSSTHFYAPFVYGVLVTGSTTLYWAGLGSFVLWGVASHALGAVQDIKSDKQAGIGSIATVIGAKNTIVFSTVMYVFSALLLLSYGLAGLCAAGIVLLYALNSGRYLSITDQRAAKARGAWKLFLRLNIYAGYMVSQLLIYVLNPTHADPQTRLVAISLTTIAGLAFGVAWAVTHVRLSEKYLLRNY